MRPSIVISPGEPELPPHLSPRAYGSFSEADSWEEIWEAGAYYHRISELLEAARHSAVFVGWQLDSRLRLHRPAPPGARGLPRRLETLREKVVRVCDNNPDLHIYFLIWDHAYFFCLERELLQGRVWDEVHPRVHFIFDNRHPSGGSHHEKVVLFDGEVALCGGIDLCDERWDSPRHRFSEPRRSLDRRTEHHGPYHDLAVQVTGPVCRDIHRHIERRWRLLSNIPFPPAPPPGRREPGRRPGIGVYVSRTIAEVDREGRPVLIREIEFLFRELIRLARRRIVFEGQYFWSRAIADALIARMEDREAPPLEIILVLADLTLATSFTRHMAYHQCERLRDLEAAAARTGARLTLGTPVARTASGTAAKPVYVHSKLLLVDDRFLAIGTANFSDRALRVDTELNLTWEARTESDRRHLRDVGRRVLEHWGLPDPESASPRPHPFRQAVFLREVRPADELRRIRREHPWMSRVHWARYFDPRLPWLYLWKRRWLRHGQVSAGTDPVLAAALGILSAGACQTLAGNPPGQAGYFAAALALTWLIPLPFAGLSALMTLQLGYAAAAPVAVSAAWVSALFGYGAARAFPHAVRRAVGDSAPAWLHERLGRRSFSGLLRALADPRAGLRAKFAYQGIYCIPFPWFALADLLLLPGALVAGLWLIQKLAPPALRHLPGFVVPAAFGLALAGGALRLARNAAASAADTRQRIEKDAAAN